jgi:hypothetical protein
LAFFAEQYISYSTLQGQAQGYPEKALLVFAGLMRAQIGGQVALT